MKKNIFIFIITITISAHLNAMEPETPPCFFNGMPADIMNLIASFLTFDDVETEEEFINRKKGPSSYPTHFYSKTKTITIEEEEEMEFDSREEEDSDLIRIQLIEKEVENSQEEICPEEPTREKFLKDRVMPFAWLQQHKNCLNNDYMRLVVYSPNKNICAITYYFSPNAIHDIFFNPPNILSIINTTTDQETHNICLYKVHKINLREKYIHNIAISSSGNVYATVYNKNTVNIGWKTFIKIKNILTQKKEYPVYPTIAGSCPTIAFNKQGTHLIMHKVNRDRSTDKDVLNHAIIPLTTAFENHMPPQKTLSRYFEQKMICKNFSH